MRKIRLALACAALLGAASSFAQTSQNNYTAMWWNAAEGGWGLNIAHQGDVLFPMWFTYNAQGQLQWYAVSGATLQADGSYRGEVFRFTGKPFNQIVGGQAFNQSTRVGTATLRFTGTTALSFSYTVDGVTQSKSLSRFVFGTEPTCTFTSGSRATATNYSDIWWNASESGWGLTLAHQSDTLFGLWYTYDAGNNPQWVAATGTRQSDGSFKGDLNRANSGTAFNLINNAAATSFPLPKTGEFTLRFSDGQTGTFTYTLDGITQSKQISRFVFGAPVSVCAADSGGNGGGGSGGDECFRRPKVGDVRTYRSTSSSGATTITERFTGTSTLDGQTVLVRETFNAQNQRIARQLDRINADSLDILLIDTYDPATGALIGTTRFSPAQRFPFNPPTTTTEFVYTGTQQLFAPVAMTQSIDYVTRFKRLANEAVTAPIGSYASACKIELYTRVTTSVAGFSFTGESQGPTWVLPSVGQIRNDQTQTSSAQSGSTRQLDELLSFTPGN